MGPPNSLKLRTDAVELIRRLHSVSGALVLSEERAAAILSQFPNYQVDLAFTALTMLPRPAWVVTMAGEYPAQLLAKAKTG